MTQQAALKPINVFVSSRVSELLQERKDVVHDLYSRGFRPLFFEADPREINDKDANKSKLKDVVYKLLDNAQRFVLIYYMTEGLESTKYEGTEITPIHYEYQTFRDLHDGKPDKRPIHIFWKVPDKALWKYSDKYGEIPLLEDLLPDWLYKDFKDVLNPEDIAQLMDKDSGSGSFNPIIVKGSKENEAEHITLTVVRKRHDIKEAVRRHFEDRGDEAYETLRSYDDLYVTRYRGRDFVGLIHKLSEYFFKMNINVVHLSHSSSPYISMASLYVSYYYHQGDYPTDKTITDYMKKYFEEYPEETQPPTDFGYFSLADDLSDKERKLLNKYEKEFDFKTSVYGIKSAKEEVKFEEYYLEIKTLDVPGQIFAVTRALRRLKFNILDLVLKPGNIRFEKQRTLTIWIQKLADDKESTRKNMVDLELKLSSLIGVRAFTIQPVGEALYPKNNC